jgi:hypothetical protein
MNLHEGPLHGEKKGIGTLTIDGTMMMISDLVTLDVYY